MFYMNSTRLWSFRPKIDSHKVVSPGRKSIRPMANNSLQQGLLRKDPAISIMTFEILKECTWAALYIKSTCTAAIVSIFDIICVKFSLEKVDPHVFSRTFFRL